MQYSKFVVDESPFCVWEWDLQSRNLSFIESVDSSYFEHLANLYFNALENNEEKQYAALSFRIAYSHSLETFLAFLFSAIQAPDCVVGWTHKYQIQHLRSLIEKVNNRQKLLTKVEIKPVTWESIAHAILAFHLEDKEKENRIKDNYARAWRQLANDFANVSFSKEYNSIKHGLRVRTGGFSLAIGAEDTPGAPAAPSKMKLLGESEYGSTFYSIEDFDKYNFRLCHNSRNWQLEKFYYGLYLLSYSLHNVLTFLKIANGVKPETVEFSWPIDDELYDFPWKMLPSITQISMHNIISKEQINLQTKQDIISIYDK